MSEPRPTRNAARERESTLNSLRRVTQGRVRAAPEYESAGVVMSAPARDEERHLPRGLRDSQACVNPPRQTARLSGSLRRFGLASKTRNFRPARSKSRAATRSNPERS